MSKLSLTPNGAGTGTYTLASPNNNASHTLTLPVATGELLTSTGDGSGLTALTSGNLTGALPAIDGSGLTALTSGNLTGALPAIDGSALTGIATTPTSAQVGTATAGLSDGDVGTYAALAQPSKSNLRVTGSTLAGSSLRYTGFGGDVSDNAYPAGTWRIMGRIPSVTSTEANASIWLRIS